MTQENNENRPQKTKGAHRKSETQKQDGSKDGGNRGKEYRGCAKTLIIFCLIH